MDEQGSEPVETGRHPFRIETVRGEPFQAAGRVLIPEARVVSSSRVRGTIGTNRQSGWGAGLVHVLPTAIIEQTEDGESRLPLGDGTRRALLGLAAAGGGIVLFFSLLRYLVGKIRNAMEGA